MTKKQRQTVLWYQLYMVVSEPLFWGPIVIYSLTTLANMTLPQIFVMEAVITAVLVVLQIPAGALADVIGKKRATLIGRGFLLLSICSFASMTDATGAWLGNLFWAIGYALTSASESSLLYEPLAAAGQHDRFRQIQGQAISWRFLVLACTCLSVVFLADVHPRLPLWLSIPGMVLAFVLVLKMSESVTKSTYSMRAQYRMMYTGLRFVRKTPIIMWLIGFAALIHMVSKVWFFTYNPYFELVGVPVPQFGYIFFLLNIVAWFSSRYADAIERWLGELQLVVLCVLLLGVPIVLMALFPVYAMAYVVLAQNLVRGFIRPFTEDFVHHHVTSADSGDVRATVMAVKHAVVQTVSAIGLVLMAFALGAVSLGTCLFILGLTCLALGMVVVVIYLRINRE